MAARRCSVLTEEITAQSFPKPGRFTKAFVSCNNFKRRRMSYTTGKNCSLLGSNKQHAHTKKAIHASAAVSKRKDTTYLSASQLYTIILHTTLCLHWTKHNYMVLHSIRDQDMPSNGSGPARRCFDVTHICVGSGRTAPPRCRCFVSTIHLVL